MKWYPVIKDLLVKGLKFPVLILDSEGFVQAFLTEDMLKAHMISAALGMERNFLITHWAHFTLPSKRTRKQNTKGSL